MDPTQFGADALAALVTGAGAPIWAAGIMIIIETIKSIPEFERLLTGHEKLTAFILSAILVIASYVVALGVVPPSIELSVAGVVLAVMSWFTVARLSMALHDDRNRRAGSLTEPSAAELAADDPQDTIPDTRPALVDESLLEPDPAVPGADPRVPGDSP